MKKRLMRISKLFLPATLVFVFACGTKKDKEPDRKEDTGEKEAKLEKQGFGAPTSAEASTYFSQAEKHLAKMCKEKNYKACFKLGKYFEDSDPDSANQNGAGKLYDQACEGGYLDGCIKKIFYKFANPLSDTEKNKKFMEIMDDRCDKGKVLACAKAATFRGTVDREKYRQKSEKLYKEHIDKNESRCEAGDLKGCVNLVGLYGRFVGALDQAKSKHFYNISKNLGLSSCEDGNWESCRIYADLLSHPLAEEGSKDESLKYHTKACEAGDGLACLAAGVMVQYGVVQNEIKRTEKAHERHYSLKIAKGLYSKGCELGDMESCRELARLSIVGEGGKRDEEAHKKTLVKTIEAATDGCNKGKISNCSTLLSIIDDRSMLVENRIELETIAFKPLHKVRDACKRGNKEKCDAYLDFIVERERKPRIPLIESHTTWEDFKDGLIKGCKSGNADICLKVARNKRASQDKDFGDYFTLAYESALKKCEAGNPDSCITFSQTGLVVPKDKRKGISVEESKYKVAREQYQAACDDKDYESCQKLAQAFTRDKERRKDKEGIHSLVQKAKDTSKEKCDKGDPKSCLFAGNVWKNWFLYVQDFETDRKMREQIKKEIDEENKHYESACNEGSYFACKKSGNQSKGRKILNKECDAGKFLSCNQLTDMYWYGKGGPRDTNKVKEINERICNDHGKCYNLANMYYNGLLVKADKDKGKALLEKCCETEDPLCCQSLRWQNLSSRYTNMSATIHAIELLE